VITFEISVHSHPRPVPGYLARRVFQGWRAASGRALRMILRLFANGTVKMKIAGCRLRLLSGDSGEWRE
jgi:hypothetical protein